jgi:membrane protein DedA with SNARE-associated domain
VIAQALQSMTAVLLAAGPWLGPLLGCAAFAEAIVVVGLFVPVTPLLVASGAAMGGGLISPGLLPWIVAGGFLGSLASYEFGRQLRSRGFAQPRLPQAAKRWAEQLFQRHGIVAIFVARFLGPPATVAPFLAGWSLLPRLKFLAANAAANLAWAPAMVAMGFAGGWLATR